MVMGNSEKYCHLEHTMEGPGHQCKILDRIVKMTVSNRKKGSKYLEAVQVLQG